MEGGRWTVEELVERANALRRKLMGSDDPVMIQ